MARRPFLGLRTALYPVPDLEKAKAFYRAALETEPYFDQPFYVGFNVGGFELGLDPDLSTVAPGAQGVVAYWGVADASAEWARLLGLGAREVAAPREVGGGIAVATLADPFGNLIGIIENPHFPNNEGDGAPEPAPAKREPAARAKKAKKTAKKTKATERAKKATNAKTKTSRSRRSSR